MFVWNSFLCRIKAFTFEEWFEREFYDIEYWTSYFMKRNGTGISVREEICWVKRGNCRKSKNRKPSFSSILSNCLYSHGIIVNTLLKISKRRLYYVKKKKKSFSILMKLFFFPVFIRNKLLTRRRICNFQFHREWIFLQFIDEWGYISFIYLEIIIERWNFLRDIQRRRNIDLLSFFREMDNIIREMEFL